LKGPGLRKLDLAAIALSVAVTALLALRVYAAPPPRESSVLIQAPTGRWIYPLSRALVFSATGPPDSCVVAIRSGTVRVLTSDCPRLICIQTGTVSRPGEWIACLPHQVFIRIDGSPAGQDRTDAVAF